MDDAPLERGIKVIDMLYRTYDFRSRTLLTSIDGFTALLQAGGLTDRQIWEYGEIVRACTEALRIQGQKTQDQLREFSAYPE